MRKLNLLCLVLFSTMAAYGQVTVTGRAIEEFETIKRNTTIVPISKNIPSEVRQQYVDVFEKYWKITDIKVIDLEELEDYDKKLEYNYVIPYYSFKEVDAVTTEKFGLRFYTYTVPRSKKRAEGGEMDERELGHIYLNINHGDPELPYPASESGLRPALSYVYSNSYQKIENQSPGLLKVYVQVLQNRLTENLRNEDEYVSKKDLRKLSRSTLYVPSTLLYSQDNSLSEEEKKEIVDDVFQDYPYKYEVVEMSELSEMCLNAIQPTYVLLYWFSSPTDDVMIVDASTGTMVYEIFDSYSRSRSLRSKDLKKITKEIE